MGEGLTGPLRAPDHLNVRTRVDDRATPVVVPGTAVEPLSQGDAPGVAVRRVTHAGEVVTGTPGAP